MTRKSKDPKRKLKVKPSAIARAPEKNRKEFESIVSNIRRNDDDKLVIRSVEKMEGTGYFKLNDDKNPVGITFANCPGNLALSSIIGQLVKNTIEDRSLQPLVLVLIPSNKSNPEILCLITDEDKTETMYRLSRLKEYNIAFMNQKPDLDELFDEEIQVDDL
jgi:rRNA maturation protein Rpf1